MTQVTLQALHKKSGNERLSR